MYTATGKCGLIPVYLPSSLVWHPSNSFPHNSSYFCWWKLASSHDSFILLTPFSMSDIILASHWRMERPNSSYRLKEWGGWVWGGQASPYKSPPSGEHIAISLHKAEFTRLLRLRKRNYFCWKGTLRDAKDSQLYLSPSKCTHCNTESPIYFRSIL